MASAAGSGWSRPSRFVSEPRSASQPSTVASSPSGAGRGCSRSSGSSGLVLPARCYPRERRGEHQQTGARGGGRCGTDPRQDRYVEPGDALGQGNAVVTECSRRVDLQHDDRPVPLGLGEPLLEVGHHRCGRSVPRPAARRPARAPLPSMASRREPRWRARSTTGRCGACRHLTRRQARGILGATVPESSVPRRPDPRPISDRIVFKPFALLLLVPVILLASGLFAIVIAPPFVGAAFGIMRIDAKLAALGADFTRIPRFPERSTIYANDGTTELATVYLDNRELIRLKDVSQHAKNAVLAIEDAEFYDHGRAQLELARAGDDRERQGWRGGAGRVDDHPAARRRHARAESERSDVREQGAGARDRHPGGGEVLQGRDLRAVPEPGLLRQRGLRHRHRLGVLLQEACAGAHPRRGSDPRRHDQDPRESTTPSTARRRP